MKFKRLLGAALLGTGLVAGLASCGGEDESHTIVFYHTMGDSLQAVLNPAIEKFEKEHNGWKVKSTVISGGYDGVKDAITADLQAQTPPSVAYCYADHVADYLTTDKVVDLNKWIKDPEVGFTAAEVADFVEGYYNEGTEFGDTSKMYTLPYSKSTEVVYYNKDVVKELGLENVVKPDWTWDDFWGACKVIKESEYKGWYPMGYDSEANWFITYCEQAGYGYTSADENNHYLFNNNDTKAWLQEIKDYYGKGYFTTQTVLGGYTSNLFTKKRWNYDGDGNRVDDKDNSKSIQSCVFSIGSTGGASHQTSTEFNVGIVNIPRVKGKDLKCISQGPSLVMFDQNNDEKQKMTWLFVKSILEPEYQASFSRASGYMPVRKSALEIPAYKQWLEEAEDNKDIIAQTSKVASTLVANYFTSPAFRGSSKARTQINAALVAAISGTKTIDEALQDAFDECNF